MRAIDLLISICGYSIALSIALQNQKTGIRLSLLNAAEYLSRYKLVLRILHAENRPVSEVDELQSFLLLVFLFHIDHGWQGPLEVIWDVIQSPPTYTEINILHGSNVVAERLSKVYRGRRRGTAWQLVR